VTVYIPTLGRIDLKLRAHLPRWLEQDMPIRLVVPVGEWEEHRAFVREMGWNSQIKVFKLPPNSFGLGASRNWIVKHAAKNGLKSIIICDDDVRPAKGTDMWLLVEDAEEPDTLGVGATHGLQDRFTGGAISANSGVILCPGGWGFTCFSLNVATALECGNFDPRLHALADDAELARNGIKRGIPWKVDCDVKIELNQKRYDPGGMSTVFPNRADRNAAERECMAIIHERWPEFTNHPDKKVRTSWQKLLDAYIPDWRERSAIHGGSL
jgi:hypothetical protein